MKTFFPGLLSEFDNHHLVISLADKKSGLSGFIAIHRGNAKQPAFGATRIWPYASSQEALRDALRLSEAMSYKAALAGLPYGGAKAALIGGFPAKKRMHILEAYASRVNALHGGFITGTDVGLTTQDLRILRKRSPYMVGLKVNPERYTALGMFFSVRSLFQEVFGKKDITGRSFAIQGLGKVGSEFLKLIYKEAGTVFVADIQTELVRKAKKLFPRIRAVSPVAIATQKVDIYVPCALSHALNSKSIPKLRCSLVVGGANNQLENEKVGDTLFSQGIFYAPDYVVNAGGLISVTDEFEHNTPSAKRIGEKVKRIGETIRRIFRESAKQKTPPNRIADAAAESLFKADHEH